VVVSLFAVATGLAASLCLLFALLVAGGTAVLSLWILTATGSMALSSCCCSAAWSVRLWIV